MLNSYDTLKLNNIITKYSIKNANNLYKAVAVGKYGIRFREDIYTKDLSDDFTKNKVIFKDTITFGMGSTQIDFGIVKDDSYYCVSPAYHTYKINIKKIETNYFSYLMNKHNKRMSLLYMIISSRQGKTLDFDSLLCHQFLIPKQIEQIKISSLLTKIDNLINEKEKELTYIKSVYVGVSRKIFSNYNNVPVKLGEVCDITSGKRLPKGNELTENIQKNKYLRVTDIEPFGVKKNTNILYVPNICANNIKNYKIYSEELFISVAGSIGIVGILPDSLNKINLTENANRISNVKCNNYYLLHLLNAQIYQEYFKNHCTTSSQPKLALNVIRNMPICLHPKEEQEKISRSLEGLRKLSTILEEELTKYKQFRTHVINKMLV